MLSLEVVAIGLRKWQQAHSTFKAWYLHTNNRSAVRMRLLLNAQSIVPGEKVSYFVRSSLIVTFFFGGKGTRTITKNKEIEQVKMIRINSMRHYTIHLQRKDINHRLYMTPGVSSLLPSLFPRLLLQTLVIHVCLPRASRRYRNPRVSIHLTTSGCVPSRAVRIVSDHLRISYTCSQIKAAPHTWPARDSSTVYRHCHATQPLWAIIDERSN